MKLVDVPSRCNRERGRRLDDGGMSESWWTRATFSKSWDLGCLVKCLLVPYRHRVCISTLQLPTKFAESDLTRLTPWDRFYLRHGFDSWGDRIGLIGGNFFGGPKLWILYCKAWRYIESFCQFCRKAQHTEYSIIQRWMNIVMMIETGTELVKKSPKDLMVPVVDSFPMSITERMNTGNRLLEACAW